MNSESQQEEVEVLRSIYEGDSSFREMGPCTFQYKYGEDGASHSFLLEFNWPETYPETKPAIHLNAFYNKHILSSVKADICRQLDAEAEVNLGYAMTYTLIEWVKEHLEELFANQPLTLETCVADSISNLELEDKADPSLANEKKEKRVAMTKSQKRRQWDRMDGKGEKIRGWNWVDVVKHLSQTGGQVQS